MNNVPQDKQIEVIEKKTNDVMQTALQLTIDSQDKYNSCAEFLKSIKGIQKEIDLTFDQNIKDANKLHKSLVATKKKHYEPLERAEKIVKSKTITWIREQEQIAEEARRKAEEEARKAEEKRKKELERQAKNHEANGNHEKAEERREQAEEVYIPPTPVENNFEKAEGQSIKEIWHAEVTDLMAICKAIVEGKLPVTMIKPDMPKLNALARTMGGQKTYPGVKFVSEDSLAVRR